MVRKFKVMGRSAEEIELFIRLISKHINHIEWGAGNPSEVLPCRRSSSKFYNYQKWKHAWNSVHAQFNASTITIGNASLPHLYSLWSYLKSMTRKELKEPGAGKQVGKRFAPTVQRALEKLVEARENAPGTENSFRTSGEDSVESHDDSDIERQENFPVTKTKRKRRLPARLSDTSVIANPGSISPSPSSPASWSYDEQPRSRNRGNKRGVLPKKAISILRSWLFQHRKNPYPTDEHKRSMAAETSLTVVQVSNWFINARRRILLPMLDPSNPEEASLIMQLCSKSGNRKRTKLGESPNSSATPVTAAQAAAALSAATTPGAAAQNADAQSAAQWSEDGSAVEPPQPPQSPQPEQPPPENQNGRNRKGSAPQKTPGRKLVSSENAPGVPRRKSAEVPRVPKKRGRKPGVAKLAENGSGSYRWSPAEEEFLIRLVYTRIYDIECGYDRTAAVVARRDFAWDAIEKSFNASDKCQRKVTQKELRALWNYIKARTKKKRKTPSKTMPDRVTSMVDKMLQMVKKGSGGAPDPVDREQMSEEMSSESEDEVYDGVDATNGSPVNSPSGDESMSYSEGEYYSAPPYNGYSSDSEGHYAAGRALSPRSGTFNGSPSFDGSNAYSDDEPRGNAAFVGSNGSGPSRNSRPKARFVATPGRRSGVSSPTERRLGPFESRGAGALGALGALDDPDGGAGVLGRLVSQRHTPFCQPYGSAVRTVSSANPAVIVQSVPRIPDIPYIQGLSPLFNRLYDEPSPSIASESFSQTFRSNPSPPHQAVISSAERDVIDTSSLQCLSEAMEIRHPGFANIRHEENVRIVHTPEVLKEVEVSTEQTLSVDNKVSEDLSSAR